MISIIVFCSIASVFSKSKSILSLPSIQLDNLFYQNLQDKYDCDLERPLPIHDNSLWDSLRESYEEVMRVSGLGASSKKFVNGFEIKYSVSYNENNYRSIFAKENIKKGQVVYRHTSQAVFPSVRIFIEFLNHISTDLVCDAIDFCYQSSCQRFIMMDFDDMSYIIDEGEINIDYDTQDFSLVALRDLNSGEELICQGENNEYSNYDDSTVKNNNSNIDLTVEDNYSEDDLTVENNYSDDDLTVEDNYLDDKVNIERFNSVKSAIGILRELNNCEEVTKQKRPIFGKPLFILMQKIYEELSNETISQDNFGFRVKYSVNYSKTHGRGLFAREKIQKGQLVYEHTRDAYLSPDIYPEFLNRLALQENKRKDKAQGAEPYLDFLNISPSGLICDLQMWVYGQNEKDVNLELDDMLYCNGESISISANIDYFDYENMEIRALRDINDGEEFFCRY